MGVVSSSNSLPADESLFSRCVRVCQNRTCRKQGAKSVLEAFQTLSVPGVTITATSCLGQCGNGPMVLIMPDMVWYCGVRDSEVPLVVEQHLQENHKVTKMLYGRFHPK
jgi:(2Fe-2S) ferredoxin